MKQADIDRFFSKVDILGNTECWLWRGAVSSDTGYGVFWSNNRLGGAHRWSYQFFVGPIPKGLHLDHLCRVRACVNPAHLEAVTPQVNAMRGLIGSKTHCVNGHEFTEANTWIRKPFARCCRTCNRERQRARNARLKGAKSMHEYAEAVAA